MCTNKRYENNLLNRKRKGKKMQDKTIFEIVDEIKIGWNLGNSFDALPPENKETATIKEFEEGWGNPVTTKEMILEVKEAGFNTIRIPVTWWKKTDADNNYKIDIEWIKRVKEVVDYVYEEGLYVIIDAHHEDEWLVPVEENLEERKVILASIWKQIADFFKDYDYHLIFETMNEVRLIGTEFEWTEGTKEAREIINTLNATAVNAIRSTGGNNYRRPIIIPVYGARASDVAINDLEIPNDDPNIIITIHAYHPYFFCMVPNETSVWGTDEEKEDLLNLLDSVSRAAEKKNRPLVIGEFGTIDKENDTYRADYIKFYVAECKKRNIKCIIWDNNRYDTFEWESFGMFERQKLRWKNKKIIDSLMSAV